MSAGRSAAASPATLPLTRSAPGLDCQSTLSSRTASPTSRDLRSKAGSPRTHSFRFDRCVADTDRAAGGDPPRSLEGDPRPFETICCLVVKGARSPWAPGNPTPLTGR